MVIEYVSLILCHHECGQTEQDRDQYSLDCYSDASHVIHLPLRSIQRSVYPSIILIKVNIYIIL